MKDSIIDDTTQSLDTIKRLYHYYQKDDQIFNQFLDIYEAIENELSFEVLVMMQLCLIISTMKPELKYQVISIGMPEDCKALVSARRRAESLLRDSHIQALSNKGLVNL